MPRAVAEEVLSQGRRYDVAPDQPVPMWESANCFYVVLSGCIKLTRLEEDGGQLVLELLGPGAHFSASDLGSPGERSYLAAGLTAAAVGAWSNDAMARLMGRHPRLALNAAEDLDHQLKVAYRRIAELAADRVEVRLARAVLKLADLLGTREGQKVLLDLPLSREDVAMMAGTTLYTVSRVMSGWARDGLVKLGRRRIEILRYDRLAALISG